MSYWKGHFAQACWYTATQTSISSSFGVTKLFHIRTMVQVQEEFSLKYSGKHDHTDSITRYWDSATLKKSNQQPR